MQISILQDFIKSYKEAYCKEYDDSFKGQIQKIISQLNDPSMHPSSYFIKESQNIISSLDRAVNIGIVGQFSSGKSSLLNLILQKDCLPTGVVPVTFKPTFLRYAKEYCLRVEFEDGSDVIADIEELAKYTDQRQDIKQTKSLHIFAPIELLKDITLIDTPGLNANEMDSNTTLSELYNTHSLIWLSLIDNAGKKSEEDAIKAHLPILKHHSICVLNQKDKLTQDELDNVLNYVNSVFGKYFEKIIAISCKQAKEKETYELSNFTLLLEYLEKMDKKILKQEFAKRKLLELCEILRVQYELFGKIFEKLEFCFSRFKNLLEENNENLVQKINILNHQILENLKSLSNRISKEILSSVKEKKAHYYKESQKIFSKNLYVKYDYQTPFIASDDAFLAMFYNSDSMSKEIKKMKNEISKNFEILKQDLNLAYEKIQKDIMLFRSEFANIQKDNDLQSDIEFSELRTFCNASDELFLKDFKECLFKKCLELDLFFEKLNLKALANYENATKISLSFFSRKINESKELYELDSSEFSLFYPKMSEIYERVLTELNVHEFEVLLINKPIMLKIYKQMFEEFQEIISKKYELIKTRKNAFEKHLNLVSKLEEEIKNL
ncbi:dynamin family protein [Campylobacter sp. US33a]|uniref:dynamin family protein n=1 Tax=Campylobacter sp. US33a TaxID=2498120 RepID=UPI001067C09C|nr:dynamin family protein [Campylobacter sp. US33a]TEY02700.1 ATP-binding protein [Campylobacter sp. US33a]